MSGCWDAVSDSSSAASLAVEVSNVGPCGPGDAAGDLLGSWIQAGIAAGALPHPPPGQSLCPLPPSEKGTGLRVSCRTGFIAFPVLNSVNDGPVSPKKQM